MQPQLNAKELAKLLNVSARTLESLIATDQAPPHYRLGKVRRWDPEMVQQWICERAAQEKRKGEDAEK
ncbi:helix-turn-helix transcriptional regulator [Vogesella urethralis]|uniref:helix-turn-helix transcriptional regulator n=1 Tax=Vogesella urethralis TaxID=2592656 RepID=UPI0011868A21|nr:helix-turn-helix domain-containing protein [Vogesella urethralis]